MRRIVCACVAVALAAGLIGYALADHDGFDPDVEKLIKKMPRQGKGTIPKAKIIKNMPEWSGSCGRDRDEAPPPPPGGPPPAGGPDERSVDRIMDMFGNFILKEIRQHNFGKQMGRVQPPLQAGADVFVAHPPFAVCSAFPDFDMEATRYYAFEADPQTGYCMGSASVSDSNEGPSWPAYTFTYAGVGVKYTAPVTGHLNIWAKWRDVHGQGDVTDPSGANNSAFSHVTVYVQVPYSPLEANDTIIHVPPQVGTAQQLTQTVNRGSVQLHLRETGANTVVQQGQEVTIITAIRLEVRSILNTAASASTAGWVEEIKVTMVPQ